MNVSPQKVVAVVMAAAMLALTGCGGSDRYTDLEAQMEAIRKKPRGRIEPPPEFAPYQTFTYSAALLRSPFQPPLKVQTNDYVDTGRKVTPDESRPKELLENFSLEALTMVGTISRPGEPLYALVRDNTAGIHRVSPGNYMGRNYGRVVAIAPNKIELIEIVPDGQGGWVERPRTIVLKDQG